MKATSFLFAFFTLSITCCHAVDKTEPTTSVEAFKAHIEEKLQEAMAEIDTYLSNDEAGILRFYAEQIRAALPQFLECKYVRLAEPPADFPLTGATFYTAKAALPIQPFYNDFKSLCVNELVYTNLTLEERRVSHAFLLALFLLEEDKKWHSTYCTEIELLVNTFCFCVSKTQPESHDANFKRITQTFEMRVVSYHTICKLNEIARAIQRILFTEIVPSLRQYALIDTAILLEDPRLVIKHLDLFFDMPNKFQPILDAAKEEVRTVLENMQKKIGQAAVAHALPSPFVPKEN